MKIFALDCSAGPVSCAVTEDENLLGQFFLDVKLTHSQTLMPMADALLRALRLKIAEIDGFAVTSGPGSFTGVRIGIGAVKGLAEPGRQPCAGVSALEVIARPHGGGAMVCAVMDARRNQVYNALFQTEPFRRLCPDRAISADDLGTELCAMRAESPNRAIVLSGDGADKVQRLLGFPWLQTASPPLHRQTAYGAALAALEPLRHGGTDPADLTPVYLRPPQAEQARKKQADTVLPITKEG